MDLLSMIVVGMTSVARLGKYALFFVRMLIECIYAWLAIFMTDELFDSITIPWWTELIAVLLLLMTEWALKNKEEEKRRKQRSKEETLFSSFCFSKIV